MLEVADMRQLDTAKTLRFALATLLLGIGIGLLVAGAVGRLEENRDDDTGTGERVEPAQSGEAQRGFVVGHGLACSAHTERYA